ncbi:anti-virulence regulator CigR family protein [Pseudomonas sessilinigenes]|uniref:RcnB family protein n=1 Tax=Pseudomonas sessilinigenes TaxID=658629 RepID=A0ABX8MFQ5_9PSED|nr:anti-virulence regulator CigR family protein [Pseudomonas sessilinigenes]AZC24911.1 CigR (Putative inner membrane protein) [Pseudomonas sessilinigenes]QXH37956.1 RcnB family protein [Pseudomonas sessilinigenes]
MKTKSLLVVALGAALVGTCLSPQADPGKGKGHGEQHGHQGNAGDSQAGPSIDPGGIRGILEGNRGYWSPGPSLPPGIQKKLARGKPLPPGIAKKLDGRLLGHLPRYDGYEWQQAGTDLILVTIATGVIYEVLHGILD